MAAAYPNADTDSFSLAKERLQVCIEDGGDESWKDHAFRYCNKILELVEERSGRNGVFELEKAIANEDADVKCILIKLIKTRPRLELSGSEYRPDVASFMLWRSPDLPSARNIKPIAKYQTKDEQNYHLRSKYVKGQDICVNPYHYTSSHITSERNFDSPKNVKLRLLEKKQNGGGQIWKHLSMECMHKVFSVIIGTTELRGLKSLETAIIQETHETDCILIKPTDLRIQVQHKSYWTHVVPYKLWRWSHLPNLADAVQPIAKYSGAEDNCHVKKERTEYGNICINPYHYNIKQDATN